MIEINNRTRSKIDFVLIEKIVNLFLKHYKQETKDISIAFVGDLAIRQLNHQYRGFDKKTDILSFCGDDDDLGELVIDYAQIKRQSKKFSNSEEEELIFILVHGLLHLIGYEDDTDEGMQEMEDLGYKFIKKYNLYD